MIYVRGDCLLFLENSVTKESQVHQMRVTPAFYNFLDNIKFFHLKDLFYNFLNILFFSISLKLNHSSISIMALQKNKVPKVCKIRIWKWQLKISSRDCGGPWKWIQKAQVNTMDYIDKANNPIIQVRWRAESVRKFVFWSSSLESNYE